MSRTPPNLVTSRLCPAAPEQGARARVDGKFLFLGEQKLYVRGVTYGTFRPAADSTDYPDRAVVERDFEMMAANGINAIRTYTVPPHWLLDTAHAAGLRVMIGLPWEQHITFLADPRHARTIEARVRAGVQACAGHPAVLSYAIGNEIPAPVVRWHGRRAIEQFVKRLYYAAKAEDPASLVTYVNYPSTEYLDLPFLDVVAFNVYLESPRQLDAYLARLQNLAGERPLLLAEIGLDSRRHGLHAQARALNWQIRSAFAAGCAGAFVFAWTDEWHRGGHEIEDWDFGLTTRERDWKPALTTIRQAFAETPYPLDLPWPRISVIVCSYNGARCIRECLDGLQRVEYSDFEVIVVDDGSTDRTAEIAQAFPFRLIRTENRGLSSARNTGLEAATGEIVAYIDDDARPDPHWLSYLAATFMSTRHAAVGGPNLAPPGYGLVAECVANAPGGPAHVLISDREAEHIPGCNMAVRRACLETIGGFDPEFRVAGDDVDMCWRLQARGWTIGFSAAAVVWHRRRDSVRAYWRQQQGYGRAEALLERKWPSKYTPSGHLSWAGRLYGRGLVHALGWRPRRVYHGTWGSSLFQSVYQPAPGVLASLPLMPEWYLIVLALASLVGLGAWWTPLLQASPLLGLAVTATLIQAGLGAARATPFSRSTSPLARLKFRGLLMLLYLMQPLARLSGRVRHGLTPWRQRGPARHKLPRPESANIWSEQWRAADEWLKRVESQLSTRGLLVARGDPFGRWDLEARGGLLGAVRTLMTIEEHGAGRQLVRFRWWPRPAPVGVAVAAGLAVLAGVAAQDQAWISCGVLAIGSFVLATRIFQECAAASEALADALTLHLRDTSLATPVVTDRVAGGSTELLRNGHER